MGTPRKQSRREFLRAAGLCAAAGATASCASLELGQRPPNIVVIFLDDSGFADFRPFGAPAYDTPNVRQLAAEGCRFTNFHVPQAICSASRGALLTGCYPERTGLVGAHGPRAPAEPTASPPRGALTLPRTTRTTATAFTGSSTIPSRAATSARAKPTSIGSRR